MLSGAEKRIVKNSAANLEVYIAGDGPPVMMLASLGRGAEDFADLAAKLIAGGYQVIVPEPRGVGASTGAMAGLTLQDLAGDVIAIIDATTDAPLTLIGHAFGNRLARMTAALRPDLVKRLILLACGGLIEMPEESLKALIGCFDQTLSRDDHLACVKKAFFAQGNDPAVWQGGWWPEVSASSRGPCAQPPRKTGGKPAANLCWSSRPWKMQSRYPPTPTISKSVCPVA